jgi:hypothetical protein
MQHTLSRKHHTSFPPPESATPAHQSHHCFFQLKTQDSQLKTIPSDFPHVAIRNRKEEKKAP